MKEIDIQIDTKRCTQKNKKKMKRKETLVLDGKIKRQK